MRWRAFVTALFLGRIVVACRTECQADVQPSKEQLAREQKAYERGREGGICKELAYPRLTLTDDRLVLKAIDTPQKIALRSEIADDKMAPIEPLERRLRMYRDHFKQVRAAEPFQPVLYATLAPDLSTTRAANILVTAARAGYTESRLYVGDETELAIRSSSQESPRGKVLCVHPRAATFHVYFDGAKSAAVASSIQVLGEVVGETCAANSETPAGPCAAVVGIRDSSQPIGESMKIARAVLDAPAFGAHRRQTALIFAADRGGRDRPCAAPPPSP